MNADAKGLLDTVQVEEARPATVERYQRELNERRRRLEQSEQTLADSKRPEDPLRIMIDTIPALAWSCRPDGTTEFLQLLDCGKSRWPLWADRNVGSGVTVEFALCVEIVAAI
jgi:hypothetical protein